MIALNPVKKAKKVLIMAFYFPPAQISGSQRSGGLAKYLHHFGWEPIVLTIKRPGASPQGVNVIATDYSDRIARIKKLFGFSPGAGVHQQIGIQLTKNFSYHSWKSRAIKIFRELIAYPDQEAGWYGYAIESASRLLSKARVDAIVSTSYPVTAHLIARKLKQEYGVPWIADLRDLWTQNHYYSKYAAIRFWERHLEMKTLSYADALVTVSRPLADTLESLHRGKDVQCITNGFDPDDFRKVTSVLSKKFSITYTGTLYDGKRDPAMLLETIARLIEKNKIDRSVIEVVFYGPNEGWLTGDVNKYHLRDVVKVAGPVPREEAIRRQKESQMLLLLLWNDEREKGVYTGKLFEYLGSMRPIIAIGRSNSIVKDLLEDTGAGCFVSDKMQLEMVLMRHYREFISKGEVSYNANDRIGDYSYFAIAGEYSKLLNKVASFQPAKQKSGR